VAWTEEVHGGVRWAAPPVAWGGREIPDGGAMDRGEGRGWSRKYRGGAGRGRPGRGDISEQEERVGTWKGAGHAVRPGAAGRRVEVGAPAGARRRWGAPGGGSALRRRRGRRAGAGVPRGVVGRGVVLAPADLGGGVSRTPAAGGLGGGPEVRAAGVGRRE
jgi:hypothetical protein